MVFVGVFICAILFIYSLYSEKNKANPLTIFSLLWIIILIFSWFGFYNLNGTGNRTYTIISLGVLLYGIGYLVIRKFKLIFWGRSLNRKDTHKYKLRYNLIYILCIITILIYAKDFFKIFKYISEGQTLAYIRLLAQDSNSILYADRGIFESALRMIIIQPFAMALQVIVAVEFWQNKNRWKLLAMDAVLITLRVFTDGSRSLLLYLVIHFVISFIYIGKSKQAKVKKWYRNKGISKNKLLMILVGTIGMYMLIKATFSRSGEQSFKHLYYYFSMEPNMLETWIDIVDSQNKYGFGMASLNGILFPIIYIIKNLFSLRAYPTYWYENIFLLINDTDKIWKIIAQDGTKANAYVSIFWFPYLDGGIIGVIFIMLLIGAVSAYFYKNAIIKQSNKSICLYSIFIQGILMSFVRLQFADVTYALAFVFLIMFAYKNEGVEKERL